jgi:ribonuclease HI
MALVTIYTDGSCRGNGKENSFGGWAAILILGNHRKEIFGSEAPATNNRMELLAAISGLEALTRRCDVVLTTDSEYVRNGICDWITKWKANGWVAGKGSKKHPVVNRDLWERLDAASQCHNISWNWTRGHADDPLNNRCDELAQAASAALRESHGRVPQQLQLAGV